MLGGDKQRPVFFCQVTKSQRLEYYLIQKLLQIYQSLALFWSPNLINCFFQFHFLPDRDPSCYHYLGPSCLCRVHQESSTRQPCEAEGLKNFQSNITFFELTASWNQFLHFETLKKLAQRDAAGMKDLMEVCCLWVAISENIRLQLGDSAIARLDEMFVAGSLVLILCDNMMFLPHQIQNGSNVHPFGKNRVRFCLGWPRAICTWVWKFRCTNPAKKLEGVIWARKFPSQ